MKYINLKSAFGIYIVSLLASGVSPSVFGSDATGDNLSPDQIFKMARTNYASLVTYCDKGRVVTTMNNTTTTVSFVIRLARPDFFLVEWQPDHNSSNIFENSSSDAVWSSGAGDFLEKGLGPQPEGDLFVALDDTSAPSSGASANIPLIFFNAESENELNRSTFSELRQPDQKVGSVDCYVLFGESQGRTRTLWIGKNDFLIHQIQTVISAQAMQAAINKVDPESLGKVIVHDFTSIETHTNILTNKQFSRSDFIPLMTHFASPEDWNN